MQIRFYKTSFICSCLIPIAIFFSLKHIVRPDYVGNNLVPEWPDYIEINDQEQIEGLARACQLARHVLLLAGRSLRVSVCSVCVFCVFDPNSYNPVVSRSVWQQMK